jgi:hypothetical protein
MKQQTKLYIIWAALYGVCALLSLIPNPPSLLEAFMFILSMGFYVPGGILLYGAQKKGDRKTIRLIRYLAVGWLAVTAILLVLNITSVAGDAAWGKLLYYTMALVSAPMISSQVWLLPMFIWACFLFVSFKKLPKEAPIQSPKGKKAGK